MATPPTVLSGEPVPSSSSPTSSTAPSAAVAAPAPVKFPVVPLLMAVLAGLVIAAVIGGGAYWLVRSGRISLQGAAAKTADAAPVATHLVALDPLVVNLADADGNAYLRVTMALRMADVAGKKDVGASDEKGSGANVRLAAVRDTALMVLSEQTSSELLAEGGKERLKAQLKASFAGHDPELKVVDVYFTDFLVQR